MVGILNRVAVPLSKKVNKNEIKITHAYKTARVQEMVIWL